MIKEKNKRKIIKSDPLLNSKQLTPFTDEDIRSIEEQYGDFRILFNDANKKRFDLYKEKWMKENKNSFKNIKKSKKHIHSNYIEIRYV